MKAALLISLSMLLVAVLVAGGLMVYSSRSRVDTLPTYTYTPNAALASARAAIAERDAAKERVRTAISTVLSAQSKALLTGDRTAFAGVADPAARNVTSWLNDRYASLRAMGVAQWNTEVVSFTPWTLPRWQATVEVSYCFVAGCGRPSTAHLHTMWTLADPAQPKLTEIWESTPRRASPPWAQSVLRAKSGARVVVAATPANAGRLDDVLAAAEAAARVADGFAGGAVPGKYVIYLAGAADWNKWPYGDEGQWVAGYASEATESVVVNLRALRSIKLDVMLRHEMTHVASLAGRSTSVKPADGWWLTEGLAEYAVAGGAPLSSYFRRTETRGFIRSRWSGDLRVGEPARNATVRDASGRYGTAYLGVRCLMQTYGRPKTLDFFQAVAVRGQPLTAAASRSLGASWTRVTSTCAAQIRRSAA